MKFICTATIHLLLLDSHSLKEKRSTIKPIIHRLQKEFNLSVSEVEKLDKWNESIILCAHASNNKSFSLSYLGKVESFILKNYRNVEVLEVKLEVI